MKLENLSVRSLVVLLLVVGTLGLAVRDQQLRPAFGDLASCRGWRIPWSTYP